MASRLTPAVQLQTNAPFPFFRTEEGSKAPSLHHSPDEKIQIESCSEYMQFDIPGSKYGDLANFILLHDLNGQPIVLSIGTDKRLRICVYVNGAAGSWKTFDISPAKDFEASVCNASKSPSNKSILIAVSGCEGGDKSMTKLYQLVIDCPNLTADEGALKGSPFENLPWIETSKNISNRMIKTLICEYFGGETQYQIVAGVNATSKEGSHFIYTPSKSNDWVAARFPQQVEVIRSVVPANLPTLGSGYIVLFEDNSSTKEISCLFQGDGVSKQVYLNGLKNPKRLFPSVNRKGLSDILVAADNGIGFIDSNKMIDPPRILLQDIGCSTLLGSEFVKSKEESTLLIYAVSDHGELYVVEGSRKGKQVDFPSTVPIPIRSGISNIAGRINHLTGVFETIYVTNDDNNLKHLTRDPITTLWKEADMIVKSKIPNAKIKTPCFLVTITLSNGKGVPVPAGYELQLSSSPNLAYINDHSYNIDRRPQIISANAFGQLQIILPSPDSFCAGPISISFMPDTKEERIFKVQPAQRVLHTLGKLNTGDALKHAKASDGRSLFSDRMKQENGENFDQAAEIFSKIPQMIATTDANDEDTNADKGNKEITISWEKTPTGSSKSDTSWLSDAVDAIGESIGDVIELIKFVVKGAVKIALKICGPIIRLILKIGSKVIRFVLNSVTSIVTSLSYFLENVFGIDLSDLRDFFAFRYQKVEKTQKELASLIDGGLILTSRYFHHNHETLTQCIDMLGTFIEGYMTRPYTSQELNKSESSTSSFLNNPIISNLMKFNPLGWIQEAIAEEVGDDVKIPSLNLNIGGQIFDALKKQFELLVGLVQRSWTSFQAAIGQPERVMDHLFTIFRDSFWTIFDSIKAIILALYSLVMNSFDRIIEFCQGVWEIPSMTELWKDLTNTDFSLINFVSYVAAQFLELFNLSSKPVLEDMGLSSILNDLSDKSIPSLLPKSLANDLVAYNAEITEGSFEEQINLTKSTQQQGSAEMIANPITTPRFGLMTKTVAPDNSVTINNTSSRVPSDAVRHIMGFVRSGKTLSRCSGVAIQGAVQGGSDSSPSSKGETQDMDDSFDLGRQSQATMASLTDVTVGAGSLSSQKGFGAPSMSLKSILIGNNAFGLGCRITELFLLLNYYSDAHQDAENFDGIVLETFASLASLIISCISDSPPLVAISNVLVSGGSFAGSCMAPHMGFFRICEMIGSGASALSSVLFLVKEPTCQTIAWCGVGTDAINTVLMICNSGDMAPFISIDGGGQGKTKPPVVGGDTKPFRGDDGPVVDPDAGSDEDKEKKKRIIVSEAQDAAARDLRVLIDEARAALNSCPNPGMFTAEVITTGATAAGSNYESLDAMLVVLKVSLSLIVYDWDFDPAAQGYQGHHYAFASLDEKGLRIAQNNDILNSVPNNASMRIWYDYDTRLRISNTRLQALMALGGEVRYY